VKDRLLFLLKYFAFWLLLFLLLKVVFLLTYFNFAKSLTAKELISIFTHGIRMDLSATSYLTVIIGIIWSIFFFAEGKKLWKATNILNIIFIVTTVFLCIVDLALFRHWGFRLDTTPLLYISNFSDAIASVSLFYVIMMVVIIVAVSYLLQRLFTYLFKKRACNIQKTKWYSFPAITFMLAFLIIPIRGGLSVATMNPGVVYFGQNDFANQAALNVVWNAGYSLDQMNDMKNPFVSMSKNEASAVINDLYKKDDGKTPEVFNNQRPNVIILILESFGGKVVGCVGGEKGLTPQFDSLSHTGILFSNLYASGDRSDKGIVSVLSGFPTQPGTSIIKYTSRSARLPHLAKTLNENGYESSFYYGGDINFANMNSYFNNAGYKHIITQKDFDTKVQNAKWGVHDHIVYQRILDDLDKSTSPFFVTYFTLSSHEPFDVPMKTKIPGSDEPNMYRNSICYADKSLGDFIHSASKKPWWKNTIVIMVADHGSRHPNNDPNYAVSRYHIPMLWIGGALNTKDSLISTYSCQTDIPATLLMQMGINSDKFTYSRNLLSPKALSFAFFTYNTGVGYVSDNEYVTYNLKGNVISTQKGIQLNSNLKKAKAEVQVVYDDMIYN
jgi:phosphoglycerol transferase MdoB-like AlkP superfamily enzyme